MHKLSLFIVSFSLLLALSYGKVRPFGARSIVLSSTNAGEISNYNFSMTLDTELPSNGVIEITFPVNQYIAGLGLPDSFQVYAPYPNQINATLDTDTAKTVICSVGHRKANESFTVEIRSVRNPLKIGGTGSFKISSKVGSKILDTNNNFGLIGIYEDSTTLLSAEIDFLNGASQRSGEYTSYIISLIPSVNLPSNIDIKIIFPVVYDLSLTQNSQCSEVGGLNINVTCAGNAQLKNVVIFQGFTKAISQGTVIQLKIQDVLNPANQQTTEALSYWVREVGTNNTIQKAEGVPGLVIQPGTISSVQMTNPKPNFPLYTNIDRELILSFRPSNPFNVIKIATSFPLIKSCTVINGLSMVNEITPILCSASSHVMIIKGQKTYTPQDIYLRVIQVKFLATLPSSSVKTNKVEIYTYLDQGFINLVDQDTDSAASQVQIVSLTNITSVASALATTSTAPSAANTLTYSISPNVTYTAAPSIVIELSREFTGVPTCSYALLDSSTFTTKPCVLNKGILTITLNADIANFTVTSTTPARVQVTGLSNPSIPRTYYSRYYIYSAVGVIAESSLTSFTIVKNAISTISMVPLADVLDHATIYVLTFTLPNFLEDGLFLLDEPNKLGSRIDILFKMKYTTSDTFYYDLGSGLADRSNYPCEFVGLTASVFATRPRCILIQGPSTGATATDYAIVRVVDFNAVLQGQSITINIPVKNSQYGSTAPTAIVRTYTMKDYQEYITSESTPTIVATTSNYGTVTTGSTAVLSNSSVQARSDLTLTFSVTTAVTAGSNSSIQIEYPNGYKLRRSEITVTLDGTAVSPNKLHTGGVFNFLTIELSSNLGTGSHTILINNITTSNASLTTGNNIVVRTTQAHAYVQSITLPLPTLTAGADAAGLTMTITPNILSYPYTAYQFNFTTAAYSPNTASIQVIFPASYTFDAYAECTSTLGLVDLSAAYPVTCAFSGNTLTITQFSALVPGQAITIGIFGVTNPSSAVTGLSYTVNILDSSSNKIESLSQTGTATTLIGPAFTARDLNVTDSKMTPKNPLVDAAYKLSFNPGYNLPKGAVMKITFDANFHLLFTKTVDLIDCVAQGGLYSLTDCSTTGVTLTVQFGQTTDATVPIDINYFGLISYPDNGTALTGFSATVTYKGATIASSTTFPTITTSQEIVPLSDITMDYYPRNEGEMANYFFKFNLTTTFLNSSMYFLVRFPHEYDPDLFKYFPVAESNQLTGHLNADVLSRQVIITGFQNMTVTGPITIRLWGVVNPNKIDISKTGTFTVALMYGDDVLEGNFNIPGIVPLLAPDSIQFTSLSSTSGYARHNNDFSFTFLSRADILPSKLGGYLFVDFPPPNFLMDSYAGKCDINEDFSFFVSCTLDNNRIFVNSSNPSWTSLMGPLNLYLQDIRTADDAGETLNFVVSNYDSLGKKVLSRTYSNLNPASLTYTYDGLLITVNDDKPVDLEVGTYTDEIIIKMPGPSLQAITLTPNTLDARILITPFPLKIQLGDTQVKFRVAAPREMLLQSYYITWSKTGDSLVTTYANLRRTNLRMRSGWIKRQVGSELMEFIPVGGITFPLLVLTNNPPYNELIVNLWVKNGDTLATLSKSNVTLSQGEFNQNYSITVDPTHPYPTNLQIGLSVAGKDGSSYELINDTVTIPITAMETLTPDIISASVVSTTRSTATFTFTTNTLSFIYYMISYRNVPIPTFNDVSKKIVNQTLKYSNPIFGETYIKQTPKTITFTVSGLTPGRDYDMYAYVMNLNQINNQVFKKLSFSTNKPQRTAEFILPIKQNTVTSDIKKEIISRIALMLSVDRTRLIEKFTDCAQSQDSLFYHAANMTYFHLYLLPDPTTENDNSTPLLLVRNLNSRTAEIKQFIPRLADGDLLQIQDLPYDIPTFTVRPSYLTSAYETLSFSVTLTRCGYIHAVAIPVPLSQNSSDTKMTVYQSEATVKTDYPSSFQTYSGYDTGNQPAISATMRVNDFSQDYTFVIGGLTNHLIYNVYLTTENDWPAYTELLDDTSVARVNAKTVKRKVPLNVFSINEKNYVKANDESSALKSQISWLSLLLAAIYVLLA